MIEIELNNIKKNYGLKNILNGFDLQINQGEKVALIGQNGSGKSTVLKIINGVESPDSGTVNIRRDAKIGMLNQIYEDEKEHVLVKDFLNGAFKEVFEIKEKLNEIEKKMASEVNENNLNDLIRKYGYYEERYSLLGGYDIQEKLSKICSKFFIDQDMLNRKYNLLSGGEKTRVNLAKLLLDEPDILLLDEPTNHLDIESLEYLETIIKKYKGTVLIVSHDRFFMDKVVTKTILLEQGKSNVYYGNYSYFVKEDERRTLAQFEMYKNQQKQIEKMKESIKKLRDFGDLAGNEMFFKRAKSIEKRLAKMEIIDRVDLDKKSINLNFNIKSRSGNQVINAENISKAYGDKIIFDDSNFIIGYGEKIAITGKNGSGKSTLLKMILKEDNDYTGKLEVNPSVKIGYIPQNIVIENNRQTLLDYFMNNSDLSETEARNVLAKYGFRGENVFKKISGLSGGEKVRIILMKLIRKDLNLLIFDEPTNHIDIDTREILEDALEQYKGTVLFVSHDRYFINKLADKILKIEDCKIKTITNKNTYDE